MENGVVFCPAVEWSLFEHFNELIGDDVVSDFLASSYTIVNLVPGKGYYVRVRAGYGDGRGFGKPAMSSPTYAVPSSMYIYTRNIVVDKLRGLKVIFKYIYVFIKNADCIL